MPESEFDLSKLSSLRPQGLPEGTSLEKYESSVFKPEILEGIKFDPVKESPDQYMERIKTIFPEKFQQSYLDSLWNVIQFCAEPAMVASMLMLKRRTVPQPLNEVFPAQLNQSFTALDPNDEASIQKMKIMLDPRYVSDVIAATNIAIHHLEQAKDEMLQNVRKYVKNLLLGKLPQVEAAMPIPVKLNLLKNRAVLGLNNTLAGKEQTEAFIDQVLKDNITAETQKLLIVSAISALQELRASVNTPFDPLDMATATVTASLGLMELGLPTGLSEQIRDAVAHKMGLNSIVP